MSTAGPVRRWIWAVLGAEVLIALYLFGSDIAQAFPRMFSPSDAPQLTEPVAPGDQTRRYRPDRLPARPAAPGQRLPDSSSMPDRLRIETTGDASAPALRLTGTIAPGDSMRVAEALERAVPAPAVVFLDSPGGSVADALEIGRALRSSGAATRMEAADICLSACPYMLAAGTARSVAEGAWVGVHQHYFGENAALPAFLAVEDIQRGQGKLMDYLIEMGVDPTLMRHALVTPPDEIYLLMPEELEQYRLITQIEDGAGS